MSKKRNKIGSLPVIEPNAAGIDIGATQIADRDPVPVRCFPTFTVALPRNRWQCRPTGFASVPGDFSGSIAMFPKG